MSAACTAATWLALSWAPLASAAECLPVRAKPSAEPAGWREPVHPRPFAE